MTESDYASLVREHSEARVEYERLYFAALAELDGFAEDVRAARAYMAVPDEVRDRLERAATAATEARAALDERWIAAHETLSVLRSQS